MRPLPSAPRALLVGAVAGVLLLAGPGRAECPRFVAGSQGLDSRFEWRTHPAVGDVNHDGHMDLAGNPRKGTGPQVWLGDGKGAWKPSSSGIALPGMSCGVGVALADVNQDGNLDLGVADHCLGLFVFLGDGKGAWRLAPGGRLGEAHGYEDLQFGDMDGDGHVDLVGVGSFHGGFTVLRGDGKGGFRATESDLPSAGYARDVKLIDINRDGTLDVVGSFTPEADYTLPFELWHNLVWLSDGLGGYRRGGSGIPADRQYRGVAVGDVDGDGRLDLAAAEVGYRADHKPLRVYLGNGAGTWKLSDAGLPEPRQDLSYSGVELADLDGDGHLDLIASTWLDAGLSVWLGDGKGGWRACNDSGLPSGRTELRGWGVRAADFNGDGKKDLAAGFGRRGEGMLEVWLQK